MMAFVDDKTIALATNHTLSITANILEDRTKDDGDGPRGDFDNYTWSVSADSIVGTNEDVTGQQSIVDLIDTMLAFTKVAVATNAAVPETGSIPVSGWQEGNNYPASSGEAYIDSLSITAGSTGHATASVSFKGQGELS